MEKFITLDHLKKTAQSLILDTDSKINGLSTAARTGDYNDLINKPEILNIEQSDWNQNDSTADDYIQNRTHYEEKVDNFIWADEIELEFKKATTIIANFSFLGSNDNHLKNEEIPDFIIGEEYTVIIDNIEYNLTSYYYGIENDEPAGIAIGNSDLLLNTQKTGVENNYNQDCPFLIYAANPTSAYLKRSDAQKTNDGIHTYIVSIQGPKLIYNKLNNDYLNGKLITYGSGSKAEIFNNTNNIASGIYSHAEGTGTTASGRSSHAEGYGTTASGIATHTEGYKTVAEANYAHAEGYKTIASGQYSHTEGYETTASHQRSHAEGYKTIAAGEASHTEGFHTSTSTHTGTHAEGLIGYAAAEGAHVEGHFGQWASVPVTKDSSSFTFTITNPTLCKILETGKFSINNLLFSINNSTHYKATAVTIVNDYITGFTTNDWTVKENEEWSGNINIYLGNYASGSGAHAEGASTWAKGQDSHAEGFNTIASGNHAHAEGNLTKASSTDSHAEGHETIAKGVYSHAEGYNIVAAGQYQHAQGKYNIEDTNNTYADIVGNGTAENARSNAYTLDWNGNGVYAGKVTVGAAPTANMDVATKLYVDTAMSNVSTDLVGLTDTTISNPTNDQILKYDSTTSKWVNGTLALTTDLTGLTDTAITNPTEGQILSYDSTNSKWINTTSPYLTETQVNALIAAALAAYGDGDTATYGYDDGNEVSY